MLWSLSYRGVYIVVSDVCFLVTQKKTHTKIIPLIIDVEENAHQIPCSPREVFFKKIARGILEPVNIILMILQRRVIPSPESAPMVVSSIHIKPSLNPMIIRYPTAMVIAFGS